MGLGVFQHVRTMKRLCQLPKPKALISEHHLQGHSNPTGNENLNQKTVRVMTLAERKRRNWYMVIMQVTHGHLCRTIQGRNEADTI